MTGGGSEFSELRVELAKASDDRNRILLLLKMFGVIGLLLWATAMFLYQEVEQAIDETRINRTINERNFQLSCNLYLDRTGTTPDGCKPYMDKNFHTE